MIEEIIRDLEAKIRAETISDSGKTDLLQSLAKLKAEMTALEKTSATTRERLSLLKNPVADLRASVAGWEQSHPKIVQTVNNISNTLSNLGV